MQQAQQQHVADEGASGGGGGAGATAGKGKTSTPSNASGCPVYVQTDPNVKVLAQVLYSNPILCTTTQQPVCVIAH